MFRWFFFFFFPFRFLAVLTPRVCPSPMDSGWSKVIAPLSRASSRIGGPWSTAIYFVLCVFQIKLVATRYRWNLRRSSVLFTNVFLYEQRRISLSSISIEKSPFPSSLGNSQLSSRVWSRRRKIGHSSRQSVNNSFVLFLFLAGVVKQFIQDISSPSSRFFSLFLLKLPTSTAIHDPLQFRRRKFSSLSNFHCRFHFFFLPYSNNTFFFPYYRNRKEMHFRSVWWPRIW